MKKIFILLSCSLFLLRVSGQNKETIAITPDKNKPVQIVETACGQCQLGLSGKSCDLAVRINGKSYFVDGTTIDEHGDAHAKDGFCNAVRKAEVQGEIIDNRFKATYFKLLADSPKKTKVVKKPG